MDIQQLSKQYTVRHLSPEDATMVYEIRGIIPFSTDIIRLWERWRVFLTI